jgi:hypothetical protein
LISWQWQEGRRLHRCEKSLLTGAD